MDLVWKLVQSRLDGEIPMPSEIWKETIQDKRTAAQIIEDLFQKIGGE